MPSSWPQPAVLEHLLPKEDPSTTHNQQYRVLALYKFVSPKLQKSGLATLKQELESACRDHSARGTLLIAEEGINGTICYPIQVDENDDHEPQDTLLQLLQAKFDNSLRIRISVADRPVFARLKIKIKSEIVTMHWWGDQNHQQQPNRSSSCGPCCPTERVGEYVQPSDWNKLLEDPDTLVIDTRNEYEIDVGTFRNAINPHTQSFVEFPDWIQQNLAKEPTSENKSATATANDETASNEFRNKKKIAMFCTGGIRCEKATNAAMQLIPKDIPVYHLEGGILAYLDEVSPEQSLFDGDCYVFDQRVAVTYQNQPSTRFRQKCHACRHPLANEDLEREDYTHGVSCRYCVGKLTEKQEERFAQRQRQIQLALKKGHQHIHDPKEQANKKRCVRDDTKSS